MSIILMIATRAIDLELEIVIMLYLVKEFQENDVRNGGNYMNMDERFHKRRTDHKGYYDSYNDGGYNYRRSSQTLETTSRPLSYKNLKLPLLLEVLVLMIIDMGAKTGIIILFLWCKKRRKVAIGVKISF
ncbi:hypothetical protein M9H77_16696 [Catharanthus roseus]|uniref:Uncharacterized protein n=1 Tax=Catharanthus roseus TaxID=4058 RepID=A0ACC0B2H4_CATRO|nr:hypothetical protein M9H77_16696 [Catharanthus roseus]